MGILTARHLVTAERAILLGSNGHTRGSTARRNAIIRGAVLVAILAVAGVIAYRAGWFRGVTPERVGMLRDRLRGTPGAPLVFVALYVLASALALPGTLLTLAGGAIFGTVLGTLLNWLGATLGATASFAISRWFGRDAARTLLGRRAAALDKLLAELGFAALLRLRLIPIVPFNILNFAAGLTGIGVAQYVTATAIGILPATAIYTYFASALIGGASGARAHALASAAVAGGLLIVLSFVPTLARRLGWIDKKSSALALAALLVGGSALPDVRASVLPPRGQTAAVTFDHSLFDALLKAHVASGMVDYDAFARAPEFELYLGALAHADPASLQHDEQLAFWINAYNAYTIRLITAHRERRSIRNINKTLGFVKAYGPWTEKLAVVGEHAYGLDEIEQAIIRPRYHEPRIHFALVCAAMGCPPLRSEAFTGDHLDAQLEAQARLFLLESPAKNRVDVATRTVYVSPILISFRDYIKDFGGTERAVGQFIARYYREGASKQLLEAGDFTMKQTDYDWTLNSQENARKQP
ncbi:MAG: DUF547 domain-containing protein [Gemmatimonadaceae bacterium]